MERRRWYKLGIKQKKVQLTKEEKVAARKAKQTGNAKGKSKSTNEMEGDNDGVEDNDEEDEEDDEEEDIIISKDGNRLENPHIKNDLFGYIDENGNVVYLDIEDEFLGDESTIPPLPVQKNSEEQTSILVEDGVSTITQSEKLVVGIEQVTVHLETTQLVADSEAKPDIPLPQTDLEKSTFFGRYFNEQKQPCPRINPCLMIRGNSLYIYGGVTEIGDVEITLDDCWYAGYARNFTVY